MAFYNPSTGQQNTNPPINTRPSSNSNPGSYGGQQQQLNSYGGGGYGYNQQQQQQSNDYNQPQQRPQQQQQQQQNSYQPQQQQQQQQNNNQNNHQQQQPSSSNLWQSAASNLMMSSLSSNNSNDAMLDMASSTASALAQQSISRFVPGANGVYDEMKYYFQVDNIYVRNKVGLILIPFMNKVWTRKSVNENEPNNGNNRGSGERYLRPKYDLNAPDLYIPIMALSTYSLLSSFLLGQRGAFTPSYLQDCILYCFITQCLEVLGIRFCYYLINSPVVYFDLFAYTGYKYILLNINLLLGISLGYNFYLLSLAYTGICSVYFTLKVFANNIPRVVSEGGPKREFLILGFAAAQFCTMWWLGDTRNL